MLANVLRYSTYFFNKTALIAMKTRLSRDAIAPAVVQVRTDALEETKAAGLDGTLLYNMVIVMSKVERYHFEEVDEAEAFPKRKNGLKGLACTGNGETWGTNNNSAIYSRGKTVQMWMETVALKLDAPLATCIRPSPAADQSKGKKTSPTRAQMNFCIF